MKLFNIILIIFAVCVCTGILIIISRLDLIKEQIVAIAAILASLVSKSNNSVKYGGDPIEIKYDIIVDGVNISIAIQNFMSSMTKYRTGKYVKGDELYKMTLFTLLKYTSGTIHFVFKTDSSVLNYFCSNLINICRSNIQDPVYEFIYTNLSRLHFYNATYESIDSESDEEKAMKKQATVIIESLSRRIIISDEEKIQLHMLKELDDNYIMILAQLHPNAKIVSRDLFREMQSDKPHFPSNYNVKTISYSNQTKQETTIHINVDETKDSVRQQAKIINSRLVSPFFEIKDGNVYISDNPADDMKLHKKQQADSIRQIQLLKPKYDIYGRMINDDRKLLNGHGYLIDENKNIVDNNGYILYKFDQYGRLVDQYNQLVNGDGYLTDDDGNLINGYLQKVDTSKYYFDANDRNKEFPIYRLLPSGQPPQPSQPSQPSQPPSKINANAKEFIHQAPAQSSKPLTNLNPRATVFTPASFNAEDINQSLSGAKIYPSTK